MENLFDNTITTNYDVLVLSGASQKGFLTLGALQYTIDNFFLTEINTFIGTSSGAMSCYLLCIGYSPKEILVYMCTNQILERMSNLNMVAMLQGNGASSFNPVQEHLEKMTISKIGFLPTLQDLKDRFGKMLICVTYNLTKDKTEYISYENYPTMPCLVALRMSANLPLVFEKYKYGNDFYIDGGISDNFAIQLGDKIGKKILGILLSENRESDYNIVDMGSIDYIYRLLFIPITQSNLYKCNEVSSKCKIITLVSNNKKFFDFDLNTKSKIELFCSGYSQALKNLQ